MGPLSATTFLPGLPAFVPASFLALGAGLWILTQSRIRRFPVLPEAPLGREDLPAVCLCIPARNEAPGVGPALDSWLAQDFPGLSVLVVDDGSTDGTAALLLDRARRHPGRLRVLRNDHLPEGWLGKNHALDLAVREPEALGAEWLLFVDADVHAEQGLLRRAFAFLEAHPADILALVPALDLGSGLERALLPGAMMGLLWAWPPGWIADPRRKAFCGIGAFTLVRRRAYEAAGGHRSAPMEPIDDMRLAQRVKGAGGVNRVALGGPWLHLRMYTGLLDIVRAMRKNALGVPGLWLLAPLLVLGVLGVHLSPLLLALGGYPGTGLLIWLLVPAMIAETHAAVSRGPAEWRWAFWPLSGLVVSAGVAWAFLDRIRGINHWRGRSVPLGT